jgi:hypothetical protein
MGWLPGWQKTGLYYNIANSARTPFCRIRQGCNRSDTGIQTGSIEMTQHSDLVSYLEWRQRAARRLGFGPMQKAPGSIMRTFHAISGLIRGIPG